MQIKEMLINAGKNGAAAGAFNILNYTTARAVIEAADSCGCPVILQTSVSTVKSLGLEALGGMLNQLKGLSAQPVVVHLDHCRDQELARRCLDGFWDSVMIDGSHLPMEENIEFTKEIADYAHKLGKEVEGELGVIAGVEDDIHNEKGTGVAVKDCLFHIEQTGIDIFAPAIGTAHGIYYGAPVIRYDLVEQLRGATDVPIVVHGGSGLSEEVFRKLIECGASKINISTAVKQSYLKGMREFCGINNPLEVDTAIKQEVKQAVQEHINIFSMGR